jgi:hypothetical protein
MMSPEELGIAVKSCNAEKNDSYLQSEPFQKHEIGVKSCYAENVNLLSNISNIFKEHNIAVKSCDVVNNNLWLDVYKRTRYSS